VDMDRLSPYHVPVYDTPEQRRRLWKECTKREQPVLAIRDARRGFIVRYDLQHLRVQLAPEALSGLRRRARDWRAYPTAGGDTGDADPVSEAEGVGGEAGPVSGGLHTATEGEARRLASRLSGIVFDRRRWQ